MRFVCLALALATGVHAAVPSQGDVSTAKAALTGTRTTNILQDIPGLIPYPTATPTPPNGTSGLALDNIQGDILVGMKKNKELFFFFSITNVPSFKKKLHTVVFPFITSAKRLMNVKTQPLAALNLAFSQNGLNTLGAIDDLGDTEFSGGQFSQASFLGDDSATWRPEFARSNIHGVFLIASDSDFLVNAMVTLLRGVFANDITERYRLLGNVRPGKEAGHEMFGYLDGIAQPGIAQFQTLLPGQQVVDPGVILVGEQGDPVPRPTWAKDGSFLAFRQLQQLVPEFDGFVTANAPPVANLTTQESIDLLGARMVGRWKSGAPVDNFSLRDQPSIGKDAMQNNNFDFSHDGSDMTSDQSHCPFAAHIRKTRPRKDLIAPANSIMRAGIPYGPEVSKKEATNGKSDPADSANERGLAFVSYQAQIGRGFQFLQHSWANNPNFIFGKNVSPGFDPIIGQNNGAARTMNGFNVNDASQNLNLPMNFVVSRGGEYFFSPSLSAIHDVLSV